jgi:hypothetical protein
MLGDAVLFQHTDRVYLTCSLQESTKFEPIKPTPLSQSVRNKFVVAYMRKQYSHQFQIPLTTSVKVEIRQNGVAYWKPLTIPKCCYRFTQHESGYLNSDRVLIFLVCVTESANLYLTDARSRRRECDKNSMTVFYRIVTTLHRTPM